MIEVKVPDIGDFADVPVIEILVAPDQEVAAEDPLLTLESDKATMDIPAPEAGVVRQLMVKVGDRVSEGTPLLKLEPASSDGAKPEQESQAAQGGAGAQAGAGGRSATRRAAPRRRPPGAGRRHRLPAPAATAPPSAPPISASRRS